MLNTTKINSLKPKDKPYKVADAHGLYIDVRPTGTKCWRQKYRYNGKEKLLSHGKYPMVTLAEARELRDKAIRQLYDHIDPARAKRRAKSESNNTFEVLAKEWHEKQSVNWKPAHSAKVWHQIETDLLPFLKDEPIDNITTTDLLEVLDRVQKRGALDIAARQRQRCDAIFKHAILTDRATHNPATQLIGVLKTKKVVHRKALDRKELPEFFSRLESTQTHDVVRLATMILIHTFVRTGELRGAKWDEFDFEEKVWTIPAERMKMDNEHLVPLTDQVIDLLMKLKVINGKREYVFASPQRPRQPLSENAILNLLYRMGYKGRATGHGFRATASTTLNEMGYNPDAIERQLAHTEQNKVKAAYNRGEYLEERTKFMSDWSRLISSMSTKIVPILKLG
jgi:integrase